MLLMKVVFNLTYIVAAWLLIGVMHMRINLVGYKDRFTTKCIYVSFIILTIGETFARICSTFETLPGLQLLVIGISSTLFIIGILFAYKYHFDLTFGALHFFLLIMAGIRLITLMFSGAKLEIQSDLIYVFFGIGAALMILKEAFQRADICFIGTGILLLLSVLLKAPSMILNNDSIIILLISAAGGLVNLSIGFLLLKDLFKRTGINMVRLR